MDPETRNTMIIMFVPIAIALAISGVPEANVPLGALLILVPAYAYLFYGLRHLSHLTKILRNQPRAFILSLKALVFYTMAYLAAKTIIELLSPSAGAAYVVLLGLNGGALALFFYWLARTFRIIESSSSRFEDMMETRASALPLVAVLLSGGVGLLYATALASTTSPTWVIVANVVILSAVLWSTKRSFDTNKKNISAQDRTVLVRLLFSAALLLNFVVLSGLQDIVYPRGSLSVALAVLGGVQIAAPILAFFLASYLIQNFRPQAAKKKGNIKNK